MKPATALLALAILLAVSSGAADAQSVGNYAAVVRTTGITYSSISGTGTSFASWRAGTSLDDNRSGFTPIGFTFYYDGQAYTQFCVSTNGYMDLSASAATGSGTGAYGYQNTQLSTVNGTLLAVAALYDDLTAPAGGSLAGNFKYLTTGSPGNQVLTAEWIALEVFGNAGPDLNFQVKLYEATGVIEIVYGTMNPATATYSYTCGVNGPTMSAAPTAAELLTQQTANTATFSNTPQNALTTVPAANSMLTFTPVQNVTPADPISITFSSITPVGMTVGWTDNSTTETYFAVFRSTDNVTFTQVGSVASTTAGTTGTTYSLAQSGLAPSTTYYFRITANNEASAPSGFLTGNQATSPPGTIVTTGTGNWSSTVPDAPWPGGVLPTAGDNVTIADGHTVTIDVAATCLSLTVGQGVSGILQYETTTARTLTVTGNVTIAAGGTFQTGAAGTVTTHVISLGGSLTNDGTLDLSTNTNTAGAGITFTGAANATFSGTGPTTDIRTLTINKGTSSASILELSPPSFAVRGSTTDGTGSAFLTLTNGTLKISGAFHGTHRCFTVAGYAIPATTGFWLNNPSFTVAAQNGSPTVTGLLRVTAGIHNVGTSQGNSIGIATGGTVIVEGGAVNVSGRLAVSSSTNAVTFNLSGGTITLNTALGHTSTTLASFDMGTAAATSVTMSAGTIILQNAGTGASGPRDYRNNAGVQNLTGGTLQLGNAASGVAKTYMLQGNIPNLVITDTSAGHTGRLLAQTNVFLNTTINPTTTLNLNGFPFLQVGATLTNNGTLTGTLANSRLYFLGVGGALVGDEQREAAGAEDLAWPLLASGAMPPPTVAQTYTGTGAVTAPLSDLSIDNPAGVTLDAALPANVITLRVNLFRGTLTNTSKVTLGNGGTTAGTTQIGYTGSTNPGGDYDGYPALNIGTGGQFAYYIQESVPRTTGFEIPASRMLSSIWIYNTNGVTLAGGGLTLTTGLTLTAGLLNTDATNLLTLANSIATPPAGSAASYVNGPLGVEFNVAVATDRTFAVGRGGAFRPLALKLVNTGGVSQTYTAEVIASPSGGTPVLPLQLLDPARYWTVGNSTNLNAAARVNLTFGADDAVPILSSARVAQANTAGGSYTSLGGTTTGTITSGTVESTVNHTPGDDFFTVGLQDLPFTWDGGAGTANWGDALNWNFDTVPTGTNSVSLNLGSATPIDVNGNFAVNDLAVGSNVTLTILGANTLTVNGSYSQSGSVVDLGSGTLSVGGATAVTAGNLNFTSGSMSATGDVTLSGGTVALGTGTTLTANAGFTLSGGTINLDSGTLEVKGAFTRTSGTFTAGTGTTVFSGAAAQAIGGGVTHYNLVFRNGGAGVPKNLTAAATFTISNDLTVESTAQLALSAATATSMTVAGNLGYAGISGGANIASLTINLTGIGKTIGGSALVAPAIVRVPDPAKTQVVEVNLLTDPAKAELSGELLDGEKPAIVLENTYERRRDEVAKLLASTDPGVRLVINLDAVTIIRNPGSFEALFVPPTTFEMGVTVASGASYTLLDNVSVGATKLLTVTGRLNCSTFTIAGAGAISVTGTGILGTATADPNGLGATVITTGANAYTDGAIIEYNASGDQTIHAANHPAAAMMYTAGSGTKALNASKIITGSSASALTKGALFVGTATTFADGGFTLSYTTGGYANVIVNGTYASSGSGGISYETGPYLSNILPVDGTAFGNLAMNFTSSTNTIDMNAAGTVNVSFRNLTFGGFAGTGTAGGTLKLNETGTTNVTVAGNVDIMPLTTTNTGGGFNGISATTGTVTVLGNLTTTSTNATQPIMGSTGTNTLTLGGAAPQILTAGASTTMFTGSTLKTDNPSGVSLGSVAPTNYTIAGTLNLASGTVTTGVNTLAISSTGTVTRTGGHVVGNLRKNVATGATTRTFEIGSPAAYTPVTTAFASVTTAGNLTAATTSTEHPSLAGSALDPARSVNRYYTLTNAGTVFTTCDATFNFDAADVDPGADPASFAVAKYDAPTWTLPAVGTRTATSTQATGLTAFSDFAIGNLPSLSIDDVSVAETNSGSVSATFTVSLSAGTGQTVTVDYATADGTATAASGDYAAIGSTTLTFNPGDPLTQTVAVTVNGDTTYEPDETFFVNLSNAASATIADSQGQATILNDDPQPSFSIDDVSVVEGNASPKTAALATFTVALSNPSSSVVTVDYATADGTATAASGDYVAIGSTTLTFNPGDPIAQTVSVTVNGDVTTEPDETFFVNLSNPTNATIGDAQGQGTIQNDDAPPSISAGDVAVVEGNSGPVSAVFTVTLSNPSSSTVTVDYATADGTATAASGDYNAIGPPQTMTFDPGDPLTQTVIVIVNGDVVSEPDETFFVDLSNPTNATLGDAQGQGTIQNDDAPPSISIDDVAVLEGNSSPKTAALATFTVTLSHPSSSMVTVDYGTADGTATAASGDYVAIGSTTLTFNPGDPLTQAVSVTVNGDIAFEPDETFFVNLSNAVNGSIADSQGQGTIQNDDAQPSFSIDDVSVAEGNASPKTAALATFTVSMSNASYQTVTVDYATADGTATAASGDYAAIGTTTLTFNPGDPLTQTVSVTVNGDVTTEPDETFFVDLSNAGNGSIADPQGQGTIQNDDAPPSISAGDVAVAEGNSGPVSAAFTVTLSNPSSQTVTVDYATADGTATAASGDYNAIPTTTLTFNPGDPLTQTVSVTVNGDTTTEPDETFFVNLSNPTNATIGDGQGQGTIQNDDAPPSISIDDVVVAEGNSSPKTATLATFTVTLSHPSSSTVAVDHATADGTATAASGDYDAIGTTTLTFNPGDPLTQTVSVTVNGDLLNEADETFFVNLSNAANATIGDNQGQGTIQNDDPLPSLSINDVAVTEGIAGPTPAAFTVTLSAPSGQIVTVSYETADGSATVANNDYVPISPAQLLTFAPGGPLTQPVTVTVNGDVSFEPDENFFVNLSGAGNATLADPQGEGTILNDDAPVCVIRVPEDFPTLQQAINAADPGGGCTVQVGAGSFAGNVLIDRPLTLLGAGMGSTFVNAASPGILVTASSVTISSLTLTGSSSDRGILVDHAGGTVNSLTVSSVEIRNFECGIWFEDAVPPLDGGSGHVVAGSNIHDNLNASPLFSGAGVNGSTTTGLEIRSTTINDNGGPGVYLKGATGTVLGDAAPKTNFFFRNAGLAVVLDSNPANVPAGFNYWGNPSPEAVIHHQPDDPPEGLVTFNDAVGATIYVDPVFQKKQQTTVFTADVKIDMNAIPQTVRQYNMVVTWNPALLDFVSAARGPYLLSGAGPNGTSFFDYGADGSRTVTEAILGGGAGATGDGTLFTLTFTTETTDGVTPLDLPVSVVLRDMANPFNDMPNSSADGSVEVDGTAPANVTAFNATPGHNKVFLTWVDPTAPDFLAGGGVEIWRAGWDAIAGPPTTSAYPEYDDLAGDEPPAVPLTRAAAAADPDWSLVTTVAPGLQALTDASFTDATRNVYFYAAFARDDVFNYAPTVPSVTHDRATSYFLGDFSRGPGDPLFGPPYGAPGPGSVVDFNDLASLSSVFAGTDPPGGPGYDAQADIGPSDDNSSFGIPTTDNVIDFEDLILFAINFGNVFPLVPPVPPAGSDATGPVVVEVEAPAGELPAGAPWIVRVRASGAEHPFAGLRVRLAYDPAVLGLESVAAGGLWSGSPTGFLGVLERPGLVSLDGAFLGAESNRAGEVAALTFRLRVAGGPAVEVARLDARGGRNQPLAVELGDVPATAVELASLPPATFALAQNDPNPFNPSTAIRFDLAAGGPVTLRIFDVRGRLVRVLADGTRAAGRHTVEWDGRDARGRPAASGVYVCRLDAGAFRDERKMTLLR